MSTAERIDPPQLVPRVIVRRDRKLPFIIAGSLLLHGAILLPLLLRKETAPPQPQEIPVELVRDPPPLPKPPAPKPPAPKPAEPKPSQPKPAEPKPAAPKPPEPKAAEPKKPEPPKPPAQKPLEKSAAEKQQEATQKRMRDLLGDNASIDPAIAMPGASADGTDGVSYHQLVMSKIAKAKRDILIAGKPGSSVVVAFTLSDTGAVANASIKSPSGSPDLDKEALAMVARGEPYPPPPPGAKRDFNFGLTMRSGP